MAFSINVVEDAAKVTGGLFVITSESLESYFSPTFFFLNIRCIDLTPVLTNCLYSCPRSHTVFLVHCKWKYIRHSNSYLLQRYILLRAFYVVFYFFLLSLTTKATK